MNLYKQFFQQCPPTLAPLSKITGISKKLFSKHWGPKQTDAFKHAKALPANKVLLSFPDPNVPFSIECDTSDYQLGAVIKQNGKPLAFSIVETLEEFRSLLKGAEIRVHTDHTNLTTISFVQSASFTGAF